MSNPNRTPYLGEMVHYRAYGTPGGEFAPACRAAVVTGMNTGPDGRSTSLFVMNPTGVFLHDSPHDEERSGGSWHFAH